MNSIDTDVVTTSESPSQDFDSLLDHYDNEDTTDNTEADSPAADKPSSEVNNLETDPSDDMDGESTSEKQTQAPTTAKSFKAKHGDKEIDIPEDAVFIKKVDGQDIEVTAKEALDDFAGRKVIARRFSEIDVKEKAVDQKIASHHSEVSNIHDKFGQIIKAAQSGQGQAAIRLIAEIGGLDAVDFEKSYIENFGKFVTEFSKLTPEQKELYYAKQREAVTAEEIKALRAEKETSTQNTALRTQVESVAKSLDLTYEQFGEIYQMLRDHPDNKDQQIGIDEVVGYHKFFQSYSQVIGVAEELGLDLDANDKLIDDVTGILQREPSFTKNDIKDIIQSANKTTIKPSDETVNRKLGAAKRSGNPSATLPNAPSKKTNPDSDYDQEDVDYLYRKK